MLLGRTLKMGMVGGGPGAFIGEVHRKASRMDGGIELVGGAFDINPRKSKQMGREQCVDPKRAYPNYQAMIEKELKLNSKQAIEDYGVAEFNARCRESVFRYVREWEELTDRIGFWIDIDDPYVTLKNEYIESVWWILKQLWDKDLIYQGYRVVPYCARCGTPLSDHEVSLG